MVSMTLLDDRRAVLAPLALLFFQVLEGEAFSIWLGAFVARLAPYLC